MAKIGRPLGQFNREKQRLFELLQALANNDANQTDVTSRWLGSTLKKSVMQIQTYLSALKKEKLISTQTTGPFKDRMTGTFYHKRVITVLRPKVRTNIQVEIGQPKYDHQEEQAFLDSLKPQIDREAILKELQSELSLIGIKMEI